MRGCEWRLLFPLRPKLERFRQAYANKIAWATHLAWGDHSSQHHFLVISIYTLEIVDFSLPLSSIFLVVELFDLGSAWFEPLAAWQEYARSSMMQSSIFRFFFWFCGVLNICVACKQPAKKIEDIPEGFYSLFRRSFVLLDSLKDLCCEQTGSLATSGIRFLCFLSEAWESGSLASKIKMVMTRGRGCAALGEEKSQSPTAAGKSISIRFLSSPTSTTCRHRRPTIRIGCWRCLEMSFSPFNDQTN